MADSIIRNEEQKEAKDPEKEILVGVSKEEAKPEDIVPFPQDISIAQILSAIVNADKKLDQMTQLFEDKIAKDEAKGELIKRLYEELRKYREDFVFDKILRRFFLDLVRLFDRISDVKERLNSSEVGSKDVINNLESFCKEMVQILKNQEVTLVEKEVDKFNEEFQEAMDIEVTDKPEEDLKIAKIIKRGFIYRGRRLLRPEIVILKKYKED